MMCGKLNCQSGEDAKSPPVSGMTSVQASATAIMVSLAPMALSIPTLARHEGARINLQL
jgi:hypothetical protein